MYNKPLISIIVPVYNAEKHLLQCIKSITTQTYHNLEIILINDGSTDNSGIICDKLASEDKRIIVIHKKNGGISSARNKGLDTATGKYIAFSDDDDIIHPNMIELLYNAIIYHNVDLAMCNTLSIYPHENIPLININDYPTQLLSNHDLLSTIFNSATDDPMHINTNCIWNKLYKKEYINNIRFKDKGFEDTYFSTLVYCNISSCIYIKAPLYYWYVRSSSKSHKRFDERNYLSIFTHYNNLLNLKQYSIPPKIQASCLLRLYKTMLYSIQNSKNTSFHTKVKKACKYLNKLQWKSFLLNKNIRLRDRIIIYILIHCSNLYALFLKLPNSFKKI